MDELSNSFSLLETGVEDGKGQSSIASDAADICESRDSDGWEVGTKLNNENGELTPVVHYKMPLVWIDLEMTGLNIESDKILEIACVITDGNLTKSIEGPDLVINQQKDCLDRMGEWCQKHHSESGMFNTEGSSKYSK